MNTESKRAIIIKEIMKKERFKKGISLTDLYLLIKKHPQFNNIYEKAIKNNVVGYKNSTRRLLQERAPNAKNFKNKHKDFWVINWGLWTYYDNPYFNKEIKIQNEIDQKIASIDTNRNLNFAEKRALVKIRINQSKFRKILLLEMQKYNNGSPLKNIFKKDILIASHIVDYVDCEEKWEQSSFNNGLILSPDIDKLFDQKYISFDPNNGQIMTKTNEIDEDTLLKMGINSKTKLPSNFLTKDRREFLKIRNQKYGF